MSRKVFSVATDWTERSTRGLTGVVSKLEESEDYFDEFMRRLENLVPGDSDAAIDALLEMCTEISTAKNPSISSLMEDIDVCGKAAVHLGQTALLKPLAETCIKSSTWVTDTLWRQVSDYARDLSECVEAIRTKRGESPELGRRGATTKGRLKEYDALQKMLEDNRFDPDGSEVVSSNCFTLVTSGTNEGFLLYDLFNRISRIANHLRQIRKYLEKMVKFISERYYPANKFV